MNEPLCSFLEWDSDFFGYRIFRLRSRDLRRGLVSRVLEECRTKRVECLYFLAAADDVESLQLAQEAGFRLVDVRMTLSWTARERGTTAPCSYIRTARTEDIPELERIAAAAHEGTRFFADPRFAGRAPSLYRHWISSSVRGSADIVLVAEMDGGPRGYATGHRGDDGVARIGLVGVGSSARGRGLGRALVAQLLRVFSERGMEKVEVVTQGRNVAAQRLYQRCGFLTADVQLWFHRWFGPASR
jgi:dTDP-4-amino-4,6-dideoxy-D-galactose acyltransferase